MNIVHISDIHFKRFYEQSEHGYKGMLASMQSPLIPLEKCLEKIQVKQAIDLLIISGDLTDGGDVEDYRELKRFIQERISDADLIVTMGNHDIKANFRMGWLNDSPSEEAYNVVKKYADFDVISFDSSVYGNSKGHISEKQLKWLEHALEETKGKPVILVTHHHLLEEQSQIPSLPKAKELLKILADYNVVGLLNGHTHHSFKTKVHQSAYYTVVGMSFVGEDLGEAQVRFEEKYGYHLYQMKDGRIIDDERQVFSTGNILKTLNMS